jgi:hypothetical protein
MEQSIRRIFKAGVQAGTRRLTLGQKNSALYFISFGGFAAAVFAFDMLMPRLTSASRTAIYTGGAILGTAVYRLIMKALARKPI